MDMLVCMHALLDGLPAGICHLHNACAPCSMCLLIKYCSQITGIAAIRISPYLCCVQDTDIQAQAAPAAEALPEPD